MKRNETEKNYAKVLKTIAKKPRFNKKKMKRAATANLANLTVVKCSAPVSTSSAKLPSPPPPPTSIPFPPPPPPSPSTSLSVEPSVTLTEEDTKLRKTPEMEEKLSNSGTKVIYNKRLSLSFEEEDVVPCDLDLVFTGKSRMIGESSSPFLCSAKCWRCPDVMNAFQEAKIIARSQILVSSIIISYFILFIPIAEVFYRQYCLFKTSSHPLFILFKFFPLLQKSTVVRVI